MFNPTNTWSRSPVSHRLVRGSNISNTDFITSTPTNSPNTTPTASSRIQNLLATSPTTLVKRLEEGGDNLTIVDSVIRQQGGSGNSVEHSEEEEALRVATFGDLADIVNRQSEGLHQLLDNSVNSDGNYFDTASYNTDSDSDEDLDMAGVALMPTHFKGQQSEDAEIWWGDVENWCTYKKLSDREKIGLIPLLLKDGAKQWFHSIDAEDRDTFDKIREKFMTQYERDEIYKWRDSAAVWATVQGEKQSVEEYFTEVVKKAQRANLSDEQTRYSIINGLKKHIRQAVLQHEPEDLQEIKKWAMIAESSGSDHDNSDIMGIIQRMEKKLDEMTVTEVERSSMKRSGSPRIPESYQPRVTFEERNRERSQSPRRSSGSGDWRGDQSRANHYSQDSPQEVGSAQYYNTRVGYHGTDIQNRGRGGNQTYYRGSRGHGRGGWNQAVQSPGGGQLQNSSQMYGYHPQQRSGECPRCGYTHTPYQQCMAMGKACMNCGKLNHFQSCCRQARGSMQQH